MGAIEKSVLIAMAVAIGGFLFAEGFRSIFNGLGFDTGLIMGMGIYICITLVVCTGVIVSQINKKK